MPLVAAQCTNCGAALQVDDAKEAAVCQYCGTPFIVEKAIHNYQINNSYQIENANIIVNDDKSFAKRMASAEEYMYQLQEYESAYKIFAEIETIAPGNHKVWYGKICSRTRNFNADITAVMITQSPSVYKELERDIENAYRTVTAEAKNEFHEKITAFLSECKQSCKSLIDDLEEKKNGVNVQESRHKGNIDDIRNNNKNIDKQITKMNRKANFIYYIDNFVTILMKITMVTGVLSIILGFISLAMACNGWPEYTVFVVFLFALGILPTVTLFIIHKVLDHLWDVNDRNTKAEEDRVKENEKRIGGTELEIQEGTKQLAEYTKIINDCNSCIRWLDTTLSKYQA